MHCGQSSFSFPSVGSPTPQIFFLAAPSAQGFVAKGCALSYRRTVWSLRPAWWPSVMPSLTPSTEEKPSCLHGSTRSMSTSWRWALHCGRAESQELGSQGRDVQASQLGRMPTALGGQWPGQQGTGIPLFITHSSIYVTSIHWVTSLESRIALGADIIK